MVRPLARSRWMKLAIASCLALAAACASTPPLQPPTTPDALLDAAAGDFHAHAPPHVAGLRHVRFGHFTGSDGAPHVLLCGELRAAETPATWTAFVTIATRGYEQWIGSAGAHWCDREGAVFDPGDLSQALQARLDRLR